MVALAQMRPGANRRDHIQVQNLSEPRLVVFGDQINDVGMFRMADEAYAVADAVPDLAQHAEAGGATLRPLIAAARDSRRLRPAVEDYPAPYT